MTIGIGLAISNRRPAIGGGGGASYSTWSPTDKSANVVLTGSNLIATANASSNHNIRGTASHTTGKWYFEVTATVPGTPGPGFGIGNASAVLDGDWIGNDVNSASQHANGTHASKGSNGGGVGFTTGQVVRVGCDLDNGKIWFSINGGLWDGSATANPATNTEGMDISGLGAVFPMAGFWTNTDAGTLNVGASAFAYTAPAGFTAWG